MGEPTIFIDNTARDARELETVGASFVNGANNAGSCAPGIGINMNEGAVDGRPSQFTLLDQFGNARDSQISQHIGGAPYVDRSSVPWPGSGGVPGTEPDGTVEYGVNPTNAAKAAADPSIDGTIAVTNTASLVVLATGWEAFTP
jgi:hypothetical protein